MRWLPGPLPDRCPVLKNDLLHRRYQSRGRPYPVRSRSVSSSFPHTVKVNHIPLTATKQELNSLFSQHGLCEFHMKHEYGMQEQHAFVNYMSLEAAQRAAQKLSGIVVSGGSITVKLQDECLPQVNCTVKVENLSKMTTEGNLKEVFGFFGTVEVSSVKINSPPNSDFNYAYVNYFNAQDAQRAVSDLNGTQVDDSVMKVKVHRSQKAQSHISCHPPVSQYGYHSSRQLNQPFCGRSTFPSPSAVPYGSANMSSAADPLPSCCMVKVSILGHLTGDDLETIFSQFGTITTTPKVICGNPNFAYIKYTSPDGAQAALSLNRQQIKGVEVGVKLKMDKEGPRPQMVTHDYVQIDCKPLLVRMLTSPDTEYKFQLQGIESCSSVKIMPMKDGNGFNISGNQENLEAAQSNLELVISKAREKLGKESFTLPCHYIPVFSKQEAATQVHQIEQKHHIEFAVYNSTTQQPVSLPIFSQFVSAQLKSHTDTPATVDVFAKFLTACPSTDREKPEANLMGIWEWKDDDGSYKTYEPEQNETFNLKFRNDPTCTFSCLITTRLGVTGYSIDFKAMTQTNVSTQRSRQIRHQPVGNGSQGEWFYTDDTRKLVPYSSQQSSEIEKAWALGNRKLSMTINGMSYELDLTQMKQVNVLTRRDRKIVRSSNSHPLINFHVYGMKDNLKQAEEAFKHELQNGMTRASVSLPSDSKGTFYSSLCKLTNMYLVSASIADGSIHFEGMLGYIDKVVIKVQEEKLLFQRKLLAQTYTVASASSHSVPQPDHWDFQGPQDEITLKSVSHGSEEWTNVERKLHASYPSAQIQTIQRIQNRWLWEKYSFSKERMHKQNKGIVNEMLLFHGTSRTPPEKVFKSRQGFDFRFCSKGMWGTGTYFAVNAKYSDSYAYQLSGSTKQMILAKVLTGETYRCEPNNDLKKPPVKKHNSETFVDELYDSVKGHARGSDIFVIYDHDKAYPEYLITYRT